MSTPKNLLVAFATLRIVTAATGGNCDDCVTYLNRRRPVLVPAINATARERRLRPTVLLLGYINEIHARHTTGLSIGNPA